MRAAGRDASAFRTLSDVVLAFPGILLAMLFSGYIVAWALVHPERIPAATERTTIAQKVYASRHLIPVVLLIVVVLGSIYTGVATATEAAA